MKTKQKYIYISIFFLLICFNLAFRSDNYEVVFADENNLILSFVAYGGLQNGINLTNLSSPQSFSQTVYWNATQDLDYIYFRDATETAGFRIQMYLSSTDFGNFVYTGDSVSQLSIDKSNFRIYSNYQSQTPLSPTKGLDEHNFTLSINSLNSCEDAQVLSAYSFHDDFYDELKQHSLSLSDSAIDYFSSEIDCEVEGRIVVNRMELNYPPYTLEGKYESKLIILIVDGV